MLVFKKQIKEAVEQRVTEAQAIADKQQIVMVVVSSQYSARKYNVYVQCAAHRDGIKPEDVYTYDGQEMKVEAVISPAVKEQAEEVQSPTKTEDKSIEFYQAGKLTRQDCINAVKSSQPFCVIRTTDRGVEILDRRPLTEKIVNPIKNVLANFGDGHYLVSENRYQELINPQPKKQLSNQDIQEMLDRNNLEISFSEKSKKWELHRLVGVRKLKLGSCEYKTPLLISVKTIDSNNQ